MTSKLYLIGLTGPTGAGKSTVASLFEQKGVPVIDCDRIARQVVEKGTPGLAALCREFGEDILNADQTLNRSRLAQKAFSSPQGSIRLNEITHPLITDEILRILKRLEEKGHLAALLDAPLLFEAGLEKICDTTIAVLAAKEERLKRILLRDGITKEAALLRMSAQKDNAFAKYQLGKLLCQGELVPKDIARGLPLLEELAENGVTFASYIAGKVYLKEEGWQDIKKAILYFRQAAEAGNPFAEYQLGRIYYFGNGVRADQEKGLEYLKGSAAHGNEYAANLLITIQQQHTWGVASCTASLIAQLGRIFQEQDQKQSQRQRPRMDRKHRREIEEKKQAMGIRD